MKELQKSDLQIGDILIYENQDFDQKTFDKLIEDGKWYNAAFYLLVYAIPWFDPGDDPKNYKNIYHAAIWGNVDVNRDEEGKAPEYKDTIVEAGPDGIVQDPLEETLVGPGVKNIYVYRYKDKKENFHNAINEHIRKFYDDTSIPYSYETAWLLAVICSMRYDDGALFEILKQHMAEWKARAMLFFITTIINSYNNNHQKKMVACSTLVAMIYKNAGCPLKIKEFVKNPKLHIPIDLSAMKEKELPMQHEKKTFEKVTFSETVVTPRQLLESSSVELVGYFPFRG